MGRRQDSSRGHSFLIGGATSIRKLWMFEEAGSTPARPPRVFQPEKKELKMTMSDETRVISSHALTVEGMTQPQVQPLNLPTGFNGYRKDSVEQYVNGLETQIWNLQRQLTEKNMVLDKR